MAILDIMNEVSGRQFRKTETGEEQVPGIVVGVVVENYHKDFPGKVRVRIPVRDEEANVLKWAKVASPYSGKEWACYFMPEKDDQVLVAFEHGSIEMPYVIAALPRDNDTVVKAASDEENQYKKIVTRHGSSLIFCDNSEEEGKKDRIELYTAGMGLQVILDNEEQSVLLQDKEKKCVMEMKAKDGDIGMTAKKSLTISVGDKIKISMDGESGTIQLEADKIRMQAGQMFEAKTDGTAKLGGQQMTIEASSSLKQSSGGMVSISGSPIKLG